MSDLLTIKDLMKLTGQNEIYLQKQCASGVIQARKDGRQWIIERSEAERYASLNPENKRGVGSARHPYFNRASELAPEASSNSRTAGNVSRMYLPCPQTDTSRLQTILTPDERLSILEKFAAIKMLDNKNIMQILSEL